MVVTGQERCAPQFTWWQGRLDRPLSVPEAGVVGTEIANVNKVVQAGNEVEWLHSVALGDPFDVFFLHPLDHP